MSKGYDETGFSQLIGNNGAWKKKELYQQAFVNYSGNVINSEEKYTENLAEKLYKDQIKISVAKIDFLKEKETLAPLHETKNIKYTLYKSTDNKRNEENIAKRMFELRCSTNKGEYAVVDFQVPVNRVNHSKDGKIDLMLINEQCVFIGELKDNKSAESLLRAILEVETYYLKVSHDKLKKCYDKENVGKAVLLFEGTRPFEEFESNKYKWTQKLLSKLDIVVFLVKGNETMNNVLPQNNHFEISKVN